MSTDNPTTAPIEIEVVPNGSEPAPQDPDYFYLSTPIQVDGKEFSRLRLNPRGVLTGKQFFTITNRYKRKFPEESSTTFNRYGSENFLSLFIAELNGIAPEDLFKLDYGDLPLMFFQAAAFHFGAGRKPNQAAPEKSEP
jgi:hypothetical protein